MRIVWFKRDLRIEDHAPLCEAVASGEPVLPLYILEPELWFRPEMSGRHYAFLTETITGLAQALEQRGAPLVVRVGEAVATFADLHARHAITAIHAHEETGLLWTYQRDRAVRAWARRAGVAVIEHRQHGVFRAARSRSGWAARWERHMRSAPLPAPGPMMGARLPSHDWPDAGALGLRPDPCPYRQRGGRGQALALLDSFLAERGRTYRTAMSTPVAGAHACSRLSAHLALGSLSMRETYQAAVAARARWCEHWDGAFLQSLTSFMSRLHWHCHFIQKLEDEPQIEVRALHPAYGDLRRPSPDHEKIVDLWARGQTGFPFVDACMRSLMATGWLNFRMRAMVMAFSSYHLWQDWRLPAQRLAQMFTDFEPGIHYPQVQMQSGVTGVNTARIYNPVKQGFDQDPDGSFIRQWVPELGGVPLPFVHEPWRAPTDVLSAHGIRLGETYPRRLVDHEGAAQFARQTIYGVRRGPAYRAVADAIQAKHGSRRAGLAPSQRRRAAQNHHQQELPFHGPTQRERPETGEI